MKKKAAQSNNKRGKSYRDEAGIKLLGARIKEIRETKKITQEELVRKTGFELRQIGRIERGEVNTSVSHVLKIAEGLDVQPNELFILPSKNIIKKK